MLAQAVTILLQDVYKRQVQAQVLNLLQELKERLGLTYFFISHNLNVVYQVSDRVGVMYLGKMVEIAAYDQLYEKRCLLYTSRCV